MNGAYRDDTPIGKLMHDFSCTQPDNMKYSLLAERARYFKETEEGHEIMCKAFEEVRNEGAKEGAKMKSLELINNLMKSMNMTLEKAMDVLMIPQEERSYIIEAMKKA